VASDGLYASLHLIPDNHAIHSLSFLQAGCPFCRPTNSVKALKAIRISCISWYLCKLQTDNRNLSNWWWWLVNMRKLPIQLYYKLCGKPGNGSPKLKQESCDSAKMTTRCTNKSKQTATPLPKVMWLGWLNSTGRYGRRWWTNIFSQTFLHVPLGVGGWPLRDEERTCWANCSCN